MASIEEVLAAKESMNPVQRTKMENALRDIFKDLTTDIHNMRVDQQSQYGTLNARLNKLLSDYDRDAQDGITRLLRKQEADIGKLTARIDALERQIVENNRLTQMLNARIDRLGHGVEEGERRPRLTDLGQSRPKATLPKVQKAKTYKEKFIDEHGGTWEEAEKFLRDNHPQYELANKARKTLLRYFDVIGGKPNTNAGWASLGQQISDHPLWEAKAGRKQWMTLTASAVAGITNAAFVFRARAPQDKKYRREDGWGDVVAGAWLSPGKLTAMHHILLEMIDDAQQEMDGA